MKANCNTCDGSGYGILPSNETRSCPDCNGTGVATADIEPLPAPFICEPPPPSWNWPLFDHLAKRHGLTLLDSEMDEIIWIVKDITKPKPNSNGLVPCRFCGSDDINPAPRRGYPVQCECNKCGAEGPAKLTAPEATEAWNA